MWNYTPASKICQIKTQMEAYDRHLFSVRNAKSIVKTNSPYRPYFLSCCSRFQNKYEKNEVEKQNSILFEKIIDIDNRQTEFKSNPPKFQLSSSRQQTNRSRGLSIDVENMKICERIQSAKSAYSKNKQIRQSTQFERYSRNISQNARRSAHFDFKQLILSQSIENNKFKKPLLKTSFMTQINNSDNSQCQHQENYQPYI